MFTIVALVGVLAIVGVTLSVISVCRYIPSRNNMWRMQYSEELGDFYVR